MSVDLALLQKLAGPYETASGFKFDIVLDSDGQLHFVVSGEPDALLIPYKGTTFRVKEFSDLTLEFVVENGAVKELRQRDPSGEYVFKRR
jgi:hypothetical protein